MKKLLTYTGCLFIALASSNVMARGGGGGGGSGGGASGNSSGSGMGGAGAYASSYQENSENAFYGDSKKFTYQHQNQHQYQYKEENTADEDRAAMNNHSFGSNR